MDRGRAGWGATLWLTAVLGALAAGAFFLWTQDTRRGSQGPEYSVNRTDGEGAALVYRLYQRSGLKPEVWDQDFSRLHGPGLILLLAPEKQQGFLGGTEGDVLPFEIKSLDGWVRQGGVAVIMTREPNSLYHAIGLIVESPKEISLKTAQPEQPSLLAPGVQKLQTNNPFGFKFGRQKSEIARMVDADEPPPPIDEIPLDQWLTLFGRKEGPRVLPQVVSAARGKGLYVAVNDVYPAGNVGLPQADNARFMLNLPRLAPAGGRIWFDEFHKRNVERGIIAYLRERSLAPALIYGLLLLGLLFWRTGSRLGAAAPLVADRRRDSVEYVRAVAALYQNAKMTREALTTIYADFRKRLIGALRMDGLTDLEEVGRRYAMRTGRPAIEARQILIETEAALARPTLEEAEALQFCARLTQLDEALHRRQEAGKDERKGRRRR